MTDRGPGAPKGPPPLPQPQQPFPPVPGVATATQVSEIGRLVVRKLDDHRAQVDQRLDVFHEELALLRQQGSDTMPSPAPEAPTSLGQHAVTGTKWVLLLIGALGLAVQAATLFKPGLVGPLETVLHLLQQTTQ